MWNWKTFVHTLVESMGFNEWSVDVDESERRGAIFIHDHPTLIKDNLPAIVESINHIAQLIAKKENTALFFFDVNNYRREREKLIGELAKAAARKVRATHEEIALPAMNSYERRLVHTELAIHPDVVTESVGSGRGRYVVVRLLNKESVLPSEAHTTNTA